MSPKEFIKQESLQDNSFVEETIEKYPYVGISIQILKKWLEYPVNDGVMCTRKLYRVIGLLQSTIKEIEK